jgi:hypothetical protein
MSGCRHFPEPSRIPNSRGYRYEVRCLDGKGESMVVGWTDLADGGALVKMVERHPSWSAPRVIDLRPEESVKA